MDQMYRPMLRARHRNRPVSPALVDRLRPSGIPLIGDMPWGAHVCLFYETKEDLLEANASYFKTGIENGEWGIWGISSPISVSDAEAALARSIPDFDFYKDLGRLVIAPDHELNIKSGRFDSLLENWNRTYERAMVAGYEGLRLSGNALWQQHANVWEEFCHFERTLDISIMGRKMLVLCTYSVSEASARDILDVVRSHHVAIGRRKGQWELLQVPGLARSPGHLTSSDDDILSLPFPGRELLTLREKTVLVQILKGASSKKAGRALRISPRTVDFHRANIMQKLGVRNAVEMVGLILGGAEDRR